MHAAPGMILWIRTNKEETARFCRTPPCTGICIPVADTKSDKWPFSKVRWTMLNKTHFQTLSCFYVLISISLLLLLNPRVDYSQNISRGILSKTSQKLWLIAMLYFCYWILDIGFDPQSQNEILKLNKRSSISTWDPQFQHSRPGWRPS